jgi:hypothetical protein
MSRYRRSSWIIATYCDYGRLGHKSLLARHYTPKTAHKAWTSMVRWYGPQAKSFQSQTYRIWQEMRHNGEVINDTGIYGHKSYA